MHLFIILVFTVFLVPRMKVCVQSVVITETDHPGPAMVLWKAYCTWGAVITKTDHPGPAMVLWKAYCTWEAVITEIEFRPSHGLWGAYCTRGVVITETDHPGPAMVYGMHGRGSVGAPGLHVGSTTSHSCFTLHCGWWAAGTRTHCDRQQSDTLGQWEQEYTCYLTAIHGMPAVKSDKK